MHMNDLWLKEQIWSHDIADRLHWWIDLSIQTSYATTGSNIAYADANEWESDPWTLKQNNLFLYKM